MIRTLRYRYPNVSESVLNDVTKYSNEKSPIDLSNSKSFISSFPICDALEQMLNEYRKGNTSNWYLSLITLEEIKKSNRCYSVSCSKTLKLKSYTGDIKTCIPKQPKEEDEDYKYFPSYSKNERFMTYLPHGDIFQQKDELENAVILAYSLNRTLIIPPIILGLNIEFINSKSLRKKLSSLGTNHNQSECFIKTIIPEHKETKYEIDINCLNDFVSYSLLQMLNITNPINDIYDITKSSTLKDLNFIRSRNEKLLSFDYLSGLDFIENDHLIFLNQLNSSIELNNPVILDISNNIINEKLVSNSVKLFTIDDSIYSNYAKKLYDEMV
ncbi:7758_t:CDS:2 [Rhizophagus irregularis]|nr:7758_t:CDS:2 [Rhizophagus irregularis]